MYNLRTSVGLKAKGLLMFKFPLNMSTTKLKEKSTAMNGIRTQ